MGGTRATRGSGGGSRARLCHIFLSHSILLGGTRRRSGTVQTMFLSHDSSHFERLGGTRRDAAVNLRKQRFKRCRAGRGAARSYEWATRRRHHLTDGSERTCRVSVRVRATRREARKRACACVPRSIEHRPARACASAARTTSGPACVASLAQACARARGGEAARRREDASRGVRAAEK